MNFVANNVSSFDLHLRSLSTPHSNNVSGFDFHLRSLLHVARRFTGRGIRSSPFRSTVVRQSETGMIRGGRRRASRGQGSAVVRYFVEGNR
ncbi:unnamed protein product [Sphenostylis stenocarpa]|uniref:Uncharacterized protein n=1 Tax=Sphenostylis stenocarpa TaxID=92480 RepID=A0AA87B8H8_9FABA|nr:unnamed protein product [Sphenostylis stenocarpa]